MILLIYWHFTNRFCSFPRANHDFFSSVRWRFLPTEIIANATEGASSAHVQFAGSWASLGPK
jgi:hypothetical protein